MYHCYISIEEQQFINNNFELVGYINPFFDFSSSLLNSINTSYINDKIIRQ